MPWEPTTEAEILAAIPDLRESETFDAKRQPGPKHKAVEYAVDVAAMANDGGSIIYGIAEPRPGVFEATPFDTAGQAERVSQGVVSNTADPAPRVRAWAVQSDVQPGKGYLVVGVEASPMAPHMVAGRFHGRKGPTNYELGQGDVDRVYARRRQWEADAAQVLDDAIGRHIVGDGSLIRLHVVVRPLLADKHLRTRAWPQWSDFITAVRCAVGSIRFAHQWDPNLGSYPELKRRTLTGAIALEGYTEYVPQQLAVFRDGTVQLVECKLAGETTVHEDGHDRTVKLVREGCVAQMTAATLAVARDLLATASYQGPVVVGVALRGADSAASLWTGRHWSPTSPATLDVMDHDYRRTERCSATDLRDPVGLARQLVGEVLDVVIPPGMPDPLELVGDGGR